MTSAPIDSVVGQITFVAELRGDPIAAFPSLTLMNRAYNLWLTDNVLLPMIARWTNENSVSAERAPSIAHDLEWGAGRTRNAFREILPTASAAGEPALLAALGVTANLQRTLGMMSLFLLGEMPKTQRTTKGVPPIFKLSRLWCGLIEYPSDAPYFVADIRPPKHATRIHPGRRDPQHLTNAFWCSVADVERECDVGLLALRHAIARDGIVHAGDLHHLHAHAAER